jgi:hypothetical protein
VSLVAGPGRYGGEQGDAILDAGVFWIIPAIKHQFFGQVGCRSGMLKVVARPDGNTNTR